MTDPSRAALCAVLLSKAAAFDNRTVTESAALAWAEAIHPTVTQADGLAIISRHYATSREWIMPADINRESRRLREERHRAAPEEPYPPDGLDPIQTIRWQKAYTRAIGDGIAPQDADTHACQQLGITRRVLGPDKTTEARALIQATTTRQETP